MYNAFAMQVGHSERDILCHAHPLPPGDLLRLVFEFRLQITSSYELHDDEHIVAFYRQTQQLYYVWMIQLSELISRMNNKRN